MLKQIAIVSQSQALSATDLSLGAAALQRQVTRDLAAHWPIDATVDAFASLDDVPSGYWPIIIKDQINQPGAGGYHTDQNGQPFALVEYTSTWSLAASHEMIEMLIDPFGKTLVPANSLDPDHPGRVQYLVEACDPCEDPEYAYTVNGLPVSDFYTPRYFDPQASAGVQYSAMGNITKPLEVLPGGYISWHNLVEDTWYQATYFGQLTIQSLGQLNMGGKSIREQIDARTPVSSRNMPAAQANAILENHQYNRRSSQARAARLQDQIDRMMNP